MTREHQDDTGSGISSQGIPLIDRRLSWERGRIERMHQDLDRSVKIVRDTPEYRLRLNLPTLSGAPGGIPYDPEGNLHTSWWRPVETKVEPDGRIVLARAREWSYKVLSPREHRKDVLTNIPKAQPVVELILAKGKGGIEETILQQKHILAGYKPGTEAAEVRFAQDVIQYTEGIMTRFVLKGGVARSDLIELATETGQWLEQQRLYNPRDLRKRKILEKLIMIPLEDSNYLVLLSRVGAVHTLAVERLTVGSKALGKFEANLQELAFEREITRWRLRFVDEQLEAIVKYISRMARNSNPTNYQKESIGKALIVIAREPLASIRVKPYLKAARWVAINIFGCREEKKEINRKILGERQADKLFARPSITELVAQGKLDAAVSRIKGCRSAIIRTLAKYEDIETAGKT